MSTIWQRRSEDRGQDRVGAVCDPAAVCAPRLHRGPMRRQAETAPWPEPGAPGLEASRLTQPTATSPATPHPPSATS